ncbi:hypothetical protein [Chamaesiphon sp. VAR_69_metabat_338]|uniref:hypothetical protein n=1 Tax=Chamaesiphon sp. VAR_69_metabat_338 TaxID=2964704 RepID=UPI00286DBCA7|nr:hypothetical protein [Chamaesiphon sp. VAR_69_metabat_338]
MSSAEQQPDSPATADQAIETVYTTVAAQHDRTDWLTVVSNLRQINRQLVEEIARLEQALASAKQTLHNQQEANQAHEITILQQQDELNVARDRVSGLFQQLESSHQIGQRQQTLIETLSQQLEIVQTIVPQIEAEHEELRQKYQQQAQKLVKTEQVAIELHRRLKLQATAATKNAEAIDTDTVDSDLQPHGTDFVEPNFDSTSTATVAAAQLAHERDLARRAAEPPTHTDEIETTIGDPEISTAEIEPAPPLTPIHLPQRHTPNWTPAPPKTTVTAATPTPHPIDWREAILQDRASKDRIQPTSDPTTDAPLSSDTVDKESVAIDEPIAKSSPNWPSITLDRQPQRGIDKTTVKIDLPKFPKKQPE